ncbi:hypothetical protein RRG08_063758 [Elysia crispata]|uniref:Uncharacterized protein n=1 Tax=Elysia crispata TaxID=231223 RepID=A0AAE1ALQ7_9GAST|nr:hypothetical protein RRG08_063758 [Elysia crispata]
MFEYFSVSDALSFSVCVGLSLSQRPQCREPCYRSNQDRRALANPRRWFFYDERFGQTVWEIRPLTSPNL